MTTAVETKAKHFSHSQHTSMLRCPKAYELDRIRHAPSIPAWWFIGGSTVHEVTETYDRLIFSGTDVNLRAEKVAEYTLMVLDELVAEEQKKKGLTNFDGWFAAGRKPGKQGYEWWRENAPLMVQNYLDWKAQVNWEIPSDDMGYPLIEYPVNPEYVFGPFKGFIDRVWQLENGDWVVGDIKTGTTPPKEPLQLGDYANALEMAGFPRPKWGSYVMVKHGTHTPLVPLDKYTTAYLEGVHGPVKKMIDLELFPPNVSDNCRTCVVQKACYSYGGEFSAFYDRLHPNYRGE